MLSSTFDAATWPAANCIDGLPTSLCASNLQNGAWLSVQIEPSAAVDYVGVFNRDDSTEYAAWLGTYEIWLGPSLGAVDATSGARLCGTARNAAASGGPFFVSCRGVQSAEYVTLRQTGDRRYLTIGELAVYSLPPSPPPAAPPPLASSPPLQPSSSPAALLHPSAPSMMPGSNRSSLSDGSGGLSAGVAVLGVLLLACVCALIVWRWRRSGRHLHSRRSYESSVTASDDVLKGRNLVNAIMQDVRTSSQQTSHCGESDLSDAVSVSFAIEQPGAPPPLPSDDSDTLQLRRSLAPEEAFAIGVHHREAQSAAGAPTMTTKGAETALPLGPSRSTESRVPPPLPPSARHSCPPSTRYTGRWPSADPSQGEFWFYFDTDDVQSGPVPTERLISLHSEGHVHERTFVWSLQRGGEWTPMNEVADLSQALSIHST